jgi:hypothetical protein
MQYSATQNMRYKIAQHYTPVSAAVACQKGTSQVHWRVGSGVHNHSIAPTVPAASNYDLFAKKYLAALPPPSNTTQRHTPALLPPPPPPPTHTHVGRILVSMHVCACSPSVDTHRHTPASAAAACQRDKLGGPWECRNWRARCTPASFLF